MFLLKPEEAVNVHPSGGIHPSCPEMFHQAGAQIQCSPLTSAQSPMEKRNVQARWLGPSDPWADTADLLREMFELMRITREVKLFLLSQRQTKKKLGIKIKAAIYPNLRKILYPKIGYYMRLN